MFPKDSFISPFLQLINALEVARNGRPKITGNELHASYFLNKILINLLFMCSMYENIDNGAFIGRKLYFVLMFKVNFLGFGLLSFFFLSFFLF
jgi:hypothetical protein